MKILFIAREEINNPIIQSKIIPLLKTLTKNNLCFFLILFNRNKKILQRFRNTNEINNKKNELEKINIKLIILPHFRGSIIDSFLIFLVGSFLVLKYKIKIVHARSYLPALFSIPLRLLWRVKIIFDMAGLMPEEYRLEGLVKNNGIKFKVLKYIEKICLQFSDTIIVVSEILRDYIARKNIKNKSNIYLIPNCVNIDLFNIDENKIKELKKKMNFQDKFVFLYSGGLSKWILLEEMLDVFIKINEVYKNAHFLIITYFDHEELLNTIKNKKISREDVTIMKLDYRSIPLFYSICDISFSLIDSSDISKKVCAPIKFVEYLASGLPVILTPSIGDTEKIIKKHNVGVIYDIQNKEKSFNELIDFIKIYRNNSIEIKKRCREVAEKYFNWENYLEYYKRIYKELL